MRKAVNRADATRMEQAETTTRSELIDRVACLWVEGLAAQDARTPADAARAAGMHSNIQIVDWLSTVHR